MNQRLKILCFLFCFFDCFSALGLSDLRPMAVAGSFYPADPSLLGQSIENDFESARQDQNVQKVLPFIKESTGPLMIISPHAGYAFSGKVAAAGYFLLRGLSFDRVILIGPHHRHFLKTVSLWPKGAFETPLGPLFVDEQTSSSLLRQGNLFREAPKFHLGEHSLEVELPFLIQALHSRSFKIIPLLLNTLDLGTLKNVAQSLSQEIQKLQNEGHRVLILISTDLSHYHPQSRAQSLDQKTLARFLDNNVKAFHDNFVIEGGEACGSSAFIVGLLLSQHLNLQKRALLEYKTSAEVTHDQSSVVGYSSLIIFNEESKKNAFPKQNQGALTSFEKDQALKLVRKTLEDFFKGRKSPSTCLLKKKGLVFSEPKAVFVTLKKQGELRGCIGRILPEESFVDAIKHMTLEAAFKDSRFSPLSRYEMLDIKIEISVLSEMKPILSPAEIDLKRHGVMVINSNKRGVFLPKVARETNWSLEKYLQELCQQKAHLGPFCWGDPRTKLFIFEALDFKE